MIQALPFLLSNIVMIKLLGQGLELEALFSKIDTDGSGSLSQEEVITYLKSITDDISEKNVKTIFEGLDTSGDKKVDLVEFKVESIQLWRYLYSLIALIKTMMNYLKEKGWKKVEISKTDKNTVTQSEVKALFNYIDKDRSGFISLEVFVFTLKALLRSI